MRSLGALAFLLGLLVSVGAVPAHATWHEARSQHFVIYAEQNPRDLTRFAEQLERYDKGLRLILKVSDTRTSQANRVTVFVLPDIAAVQNVSAGAQRKGIAGFYQDWTGGPAAFVPWATRGDQGYEMIVLQHEYAHHFLRQNFAAVFPAWLNEGLAEFAGASEFERDGTLVIGAPAKHRGIQLYSANQIRAEALLEWKIPAGNAETADRYYGRAWLLCHYLIFEPSRRGQLETYLTRLNSGAPSIETARAVFGDLDRLDRDLKAYLNKPSLSGLKLPADRLPTGPVSVRKLEAAEAAIMTVRMQSKAGMTEQEAPGIATMARKIAASFPTDPTVQIALAQAELDAQHYPEALAAAEKALAADPKAIDAFVARGVAQMHIAEAAGNRDAATWRGIRQGLIAANRLDPDHPEPLSLNYQSYLSQGIDPTDNALQGALQALELAPQDTWLRMLLIKEFLRQNRSKDARPLLIRMSSLPHDDLFRKLALDTIAALDKQGTREALELFSRSQLTSR
jgi:tetratricopeptide (TPR) repeat protein